MDSFSIIIPTYKRPASALACLDALLDLDYPREFLEVVLVEDGVAGEPLLAEDLERFIDPLRLQVIRQENAGPAAARNRGVAAASGDYLVFTDDDCKPRPDLIRALARQFEKTPSIVIGGRTENSLNDRACSEASQVLLDYIYKHFLERKEPFFTSNNLALSRENFVRVGGFDAAFSGAGGEDREFCSRCLDCGLEFLWLKDAVILHYHDLSLGGFVRQHFNYGRGAHTYHTARAKVGGSGVELEPMKFYMDLVRYPRRKERGKPVKFGVSLMLLSQAANAVGYFFEKLSSSKAKKQASSEPVSADQTGAEAEQARLVAREGAGSWSGNILGVGCRYLAMLGATHILGDRLFGDYMLTLAITGVLSTIAVLGLSPGVLPFLSRARIGSKPSEVRAVVRSAFLPVILLSLLLTALTAWAAPWASETVFDKPQLVRFLLPLSGLIAIGAISAVVTTLLQGFMAVKESVWIERVFVNGTIAAGMALSWLLELEIGGAVGASLAGGLVGLVAGFWALKRTAPGALNLKLESRPLKVGALLRFSWPMLGSGVLGFLLMWTDVLVMGVYSGSSEVGVYGACARIAVLALLTHQSLGPVFVARLSDLFTRNDWAGISHLYHMTSRWAMWPGLALAWSLALWGADVLALFGEEFRAGASVLTVLCVGKAAACSSGMAGRVFNITGKARLNLVNMLLLVGSNIGLNILWVPQYGAMGAAAATSLCLTLVRLLQVIELRFLHGILPWTRQSFIPLIGTGVLAALLVPWREGLGGNWGWLLPMALYFLACALLYFLTCFNEDDRTVWRALRGRLVGQGWGVR